MSEDPVLNYFYDVLDVGDPKNPQMVGRFETLTGGDIEVAMVPYTYVNEYGEVMTQYIPGKTTYAPITLLRAVDSASQSLYTWFQKAIAGVRKGSLRHISISMIGRHGKPTLMTWELINAIPSKLSGFSFNQRTEAYYTTVELTLHAEEIIMTYVGTEEEVDEAMSAEEIEGVEY